MPRDENLFGTYRNGSAEERMDIYLEHPGLRGRFDEIEREEAAGPSFVNRSQGKAESYGAARAAARP